MQCTVLFISQLRVACGWMGFSVAISWIQWSYFHDFSLTVSNSRKPSGKHIFGSKLKSRITLICWLCLVRKVKWIALKSFKVRRFGEIFELIPQTTVLGLTFNLKTKLVNVGRGYSCASRHNISNHVSVFSDANAVAHTHTRADTHI